MTRAAQAKLLTVAVFVIGMVSGVVLTHFYLDRLRAEAAARDSADPSRERQSLSEFLDLSAAQQDELDGILERSRERLLQLRAQTRPMYRAITEESRDEIRAMLNQTQRQDYEEWVEAERERRRARQLD